MALKKDEPGDEATIVQRWETGLTWMAHPDTEMRRASHALAVDSAERSSAGREGRRPSGSRTEPGDSRTQSGDDDVWLVDPLDAAGLDEELATLGTVAGVVVLTNSHGRHADALAERHDVAIHVPACFDDPASDFDAPVETFDEELADTGFELVWEKDGSGWKEGALYHPDRGTLVVPDALMTCLFTGRDDRLEVFPLFRWSPPRQELGALDVDRVLVGHGEPMFDDAQDALNAALGVPRREVPTAVARSVPTFARIAYTNLRG